MRYRRERWRTPALVGLLVTLAILGRQAFASGITNMLLGSGGAPTLSTTLTAGSTIVSGNGEIGYISGTIGSMTITNIPGGFTITSIYDLVVSGSVAQEFVKISGFSSSPGASWLGKVIFNNQTFQGSAATYSYTSGTATWNWGTAGGWGFTSTVAYPGTITYQ